MLKSKATHSGINGLQDSSITFNTRKYGPPGKELRVNDEEIDPETEGQIEESKEPQDPLFPLSKAAAATFVSKFHLRF